jgi:hypothetical protein
MVAEKSVKTETLNVGGATARAPRWPAEGW